MPFIMENFLIFKQNRMNEFEFQRSKIIIYLFYLYKTNIQ